MLNSSQKQMYTDQGFLVLERLLSPDDVAPIRAAADAIVDAFDIDTQRSVFSAREGEQTEDSFFFESAEKVSCFLEKDALDNDGRPVKPKHQSINKIGHALHDQVPQFNAFCRRPEFAQLLRDIGYRQPELWQTMYILKPPHIGGEVRWHQDASYLITDPPCVTGLWVAVEDATQHNSCLWFEPGGHRGPLREIFEVDPVSRASELRRLNDTPWPTSATAVPVEAPAGSVVIFNDHMPHYSSHNHSDRSRHAFSMHVSESDSIWSARNWLQRPNLAPFRI